MNLLFLISNVFKKKADAFPIIRVPGVDMADVIKSRPDMVREDRSKPEKTP